MRRANGGLFRDNEEGAFAAVWAAMRLSGAAPVRFRGLSAAGSRKARGTEAEGQE